MEDHFNTGAACLEYLWQLRWPEGFLCPRCEGRDAWHVRRGLYHCRGCDLETSVTAGTILHRTRKPLRLWFRAMWHITNQKYGANALGLQRVLNLGGYHTAWEWLHKLRRAMVRPNRDRLTGVIEVDETYVGGKKPGKRGRGAAGKALGGIAVEDKGDEGIGRIRLQHLQDASAASLEPFVQAIAEPSSVIRTDDWSGYKGLTGNGFHHGVVSSNDLKARASDCGTVETLAFGHLSGRSPTITLGVLLGQIHIPVQSADLHLSRQTVLPSGPASDDGRSRTDCHAQRPISALPRWSGQLESRPPGR